MECPICYYCKKSKTYVHPCKHELCNNCYKKITPKKCPICRCDMESLCDKKLDSYDYIAVKTTTKCKIISLNKLKKHVFSTDFKNYLREILTEPHMYVIKRTIVQLELPNQVVSYSPENLNCYNLSELFFMYEQNILRFFKYKPGVINYLIMKIKEEIQRRIKQ